MKASGCGDAGARTTATGCSAGGRRKAIGATAAPAECNTVHDGKADHWNVALKGSDLKSSFDASNPCPV